MLKYILSFKKISRWMDPLPKDFGSMYYLYPCEDSHAKGFKVAGFGQRVVEKVGNMLWKKDPTRDFKPEKIY